MKQHETPICDDQQVQEKGHRISKLLPIRNSEHHLVVQGINYPANPGHLRKRRSLPAHPCIHLSLQPMQATWGSQTRALPHPNY
ncbi:hypothetical protein CEXT_617821 [Caerostris extrusa]|uniref:Uncharacterized protein n=1 Tax=Caerostris extrusa TaxID=172846 RepID=A0AAV4PJU0_CAEEX|nr:hypothetical protein CEXT_617821 [Caerostris extrusa]